MSNIPIGLQLYSVRHELARDLRGTLQATAEMGYEGVEFFGPPQHSATELRALLDEFGLMCCGWHTPLALVQEDTLAETIAFNQTLANDKIIIPSIPAEYRQTRADWYKMAEFFNQLADRLAGHNMRTGYHNHFFDFEPVDGEMPWDIIFNNTDQRVIMQLDTGNAIYAGAEILPLIHKYPGRAVTVHLKPYTRMEDPANPYDVFRPVIGEDDTPWAEFFTACETVGGTEWYIVEYESDASPALEAVARCLQNLRAMGK